MMEKNKHIVVDIKWKEGTDYPSYKPEAVSIRPATVLDRVICGMAKIPFLRRLGRRRVMVNEDAGIAPESIATVGIKIPVSTYSALIGADRDAISMSCRQMRATAAMALIPEADYTEEDKGDYTV